MIKLNLSSTSILMGVKELGQERPRNFVKTEELSQLVDLPMDRLSEEVKYLLDLNYLEAFRALGVTPLNREVRLTALGKLYLDSLN